VPERASFDALTYVERIAHCERPENIEGPAPAAWAAINAHLGTSATRLPELVGQLGQRAFGHTPRVGDEFSRKVRFKGCSPLVRSFVFIAVSEGLRKHRDLHAGC